MGDQKKPERPSARPSEKPPPPPPPEPDPKLITYLEKGQKGGGKGPRNARVRAPRS